MKISLKILLLGSIAAFSLSSGVSAKPDFANKTGLECSSCHKGKMVDKNFTKIGRDYCIYLKDRGLLKSSNSCTRKTLDLYDVRGKHLGKHRICVPDPTPC